MLYAGLQQIFLYLNYNIKQTGAKQTGGKNG